MQNELEFRADLDAYPGHDGAVSEAAAEAVTDHGASTADFIAHVGAADFIAHVGAADFTAHVGAADFTAHVGVADFAAAHVGAAEFPADVGAASAVLSGAVVGAGSEQPGSEQPGAGHHPVRAGSDPAGRLRRQPEPAAEQHAEPGSHHDPESGPAVLGALGDSGRDQRGPARHPPSDPAPVPDLAADVAYQPADGRPRTQ
ncbi:hypothetical protein [Actinoplanes regularis]|uniref:hypothetical protein n=1 Tax=Actinoplanes regularis TaxID=52697 RepID=UPI0024A38A7A|nr:hypothetical protein [Actinoplanes regularis]GLW29167.1 hypothetical protein Areg01_21070 [Actinoplanes regularis]